MYKVQNSCLSAFGQWLFKNSPSLDVCQRLSGHKKLGVAGLYATACATMWQVSGRTAETANNYEGQTVVETPINDIKCCGQIPDFFA